MERKVQQRTLVSRQKLLDAGYELFSEKGYYNTNTKEIAKRAGISIGNVYNYFESKEEIYCELAKAYLADSNKAMEELAGRLSQDSYKAVQEELNVYLHKLLERAQGTQSFFKDASVIMRESEKLREIMASGENRIISTFEKIFRGRYPDREMNYYTVARMFYVITDSVGDDILKIEDEDDRKAYVDLMIKEILHYIYKL